MHSAAAAIPLHAVQCSPYLMHHDPDVWGTDCEQFIPERWQQWQQEAGSAGYMGLLAGMGPNGCYIPFGGGPRYVKGAPRAWRVGPTGRSGGLGQGALD